ncbi:MAG: chaperone NapD [Thermoanaerobaculum sp.]
MVIAGVVITTQPGQAPAVAVQLASVPFLRLVGGDGNERIAAVVEREDGEALEAWAEKLVASDDRILGVFPTFVGRDPA